MSGISKGSVFFTPALMILSCQNACENMIKFTLKCATGGLLFNEKRNMRKERKKIEGLSEEITVLEKMVTDDINSMQMKNKKILDSLFSDITDIQKETSDILKNNNSEEFRKLLKQSQDEIKSKIIREAELIKKNYTNLINKNNAVIIQKMSKLKETALKEIENIQNDNERKNEAAHKRCTELIESAQKLSEETKVNSADELIRQAIKDSQSGNYQSAIALASSAVTEIYMEIYRSDSAQQEIMFYSQTGLSIAEEIEIFLESIRETEFKHESGTSVVDLSLFMDGKYDEYTNELNRFKALLENNANTSPEEMKEIVCSITELYTEINESCSDAFYMMTYSLQRNEIEKEIFGLLKEKGFTLSDTFFSEGDPSKASERTYKCELTGEELTISVIPYTDDDNELKTELIVSSSGNDCSEEAREQYRKDIISQIMHDNSVESVSLSCIEETRNKNGADTGEKYRISSPEKLKNR